MSGYDFCLVSAKYDNVFKAIVSALWATRSDGNVDAPTGAFAYLDIPDNKGERHEMIDAVFSDDVELYELFKVLPAGWYVTLENSDGIIQVYAVGEGWDTHAQYLAKGWFENMLEAFATWDDQN